MDVVNFLACGEKSSLCLQKKSGDYTLATLFRSSPPFTKFLRDTPISFTNFKTKCLISQHEMYFIHMDSSVYIVNLPNSPHLKIPLTLINIHCSPPTFQSCSFVLNSCISRSFSLPTVYHKEPFRVHCCLSLVGKISVRSLSYRSFIHPSIRCRNVSNHASKISSSTLHTSSACNFVQDFLTLFFVQSILEYCSVS